MSSDQSSAKFDLDDEQIQYVSGLLSDDLILAFGNIDPAHAHLQLASGTAALIRRLWQTLFGGPWISARFEGDEYLYQTLRTNALTQLQLHFPDLVLRNLADELWPEELPTSNDLVAFPEIWNDYLLADFQTIESEITKACVIAGIDPFSKSVQALLVTHEDNVRSVEEKMRLEREHFEHQHSLGIQDDKNSESSETQSQRSGRHPVALEYEEAQGMWWDLSDELAPKRFSQPDFCDYLASQGIHIGERTLRVKIRNWRSMGMPWPPPRPTETFV